MDWTSSLFELSAASKVTPPDMLLLFENLNAPPDLRGMRLVLDNARKVLEATKGPEFNQLFGARFTGIFSLKVICQLCSTLTNWAGGGDSATWLDESPRQRGIINDHPEWAMLILSRRSPYFDDSVFRQYQSVVLHCSGLQRKRHEEVGSEIETACRSVRKIATGKLNKSLVDLGLAGCSLEDYHEKLCDENSEVISGLEGIELLIRKILQGKGKVRQTGGGHQRYSNQQIIYRSDMHDPEPVGPEIELHLLQSGEGEEETKKIRSTGLHPEERQTLRAASVVYSAKKATKGFNLRDHHRRQSRQIAHMSSLNQRLPFRYSQLSSIELSIAARSAHDLLSGKGEPKIGRYSGLLMALLLWVGRPMEQLLKMRFYQGRSNLPNDQKDLLAYLNEEDAFVLPIRSPKWRNNLQESARQLLQDIGGSPMTHVDGVIIVSSPVRISSLMTDMLGDKLPKGIGSDSELFPTRLREEIKDELVQAMSKLNDDHHLRLTPLRVSLALFDEISALTTDWTDAALLTGHGFTTTEVTAHYYSVSGEYLQQTYHEAAVSLRNRLYQYLGFDTKSFFKFEQKILNHGEHSSKLNPRPYLVRLLASHLQDQIFEAKRQLPHDEGLRQLHNALVAYTAFWILFNTGYRAVNDLVFRLREIDWATGLLVISDKDDDSESSSRVVWLQSQLLEQLRSYVLHLELLQLRAPSHGSVHEHIEDVLSNPAPEAALLFFISEKWHVTQVSPENLRSQASAFSLPMNLSRHYLRTQLRQMGCRAEYVNAFMGHWQKGQEPFGRFSTMTPFELFSVMAPYLEQLRLQAGWSNRPGLADA